MLAKAGKLILLSTPYAVLTPVSSVITASPIMEIETFLSDSLVGGILPCCVLLAELNVATQVSIGIVCLWAESKSMRSHLEGRGRRGS